MSLEDDIKGAFGFKEKEKKPNSKNRIQSIRKTESKKIIQLDANKINKKLRELNAEEYPIYSVIIRRVQSGRSSYLKDYVNFINRFISEFIKIKEV